MNDCLLIVGLSFVFLSVESYPYRQKYHGKYFQYRPFGRSSLSGLGRGLSSGFDDGFSTTSFSSSSRDDFDSLGSLGSLSSVSRRDILPERYRYQKLGHSSTYPKYFDHGRTFSGSGGFDRDLSFSSASAASGLSALSGDNFGDDFSSRSIAPISSSSSALLSGTYPRAFPKLGGYTKSLKSYPSIRSGVFSSRSGLGLSGARGFDGFNGNFDDDFSSIVPFSASSSSSAFLSRPYSRPFPKRGGYIQPGNTFSTIRGGGFSSRSGLGLPGASGFDGFDGDFDDDFTSIAPFSASSASSAYLRAPYPRTFPKFGGSHLKSHPTIRSGGFSSSSGLSLSGHRGLTDDGLSSVSPLSSLPQRGFSTRSGLSLSGLPGLDDDGLSSISQSPILPLNSYQVDPYTSYPKPLEGFRGGLTGLQSNGLTLSSGFDDDFGDDLSTLSFQSNVYPGESYHGLKHHEYDHNTRDVLGGGVRSTLIGSGGFDGDNLGDSLGLGSRLDGGFDLPGSNSFLSSSQIHSGAILKPDSYPKSGAYPKSHSKRNYI